MPKRNPALFKKTLIAVSVASLSACASLPEVSNSVGSGIVKAGKATANVTRKTWNNTTYLLGFSDSVDGKDASTDDKQPVVVETDVNQVLPLDAAPSIQGELADADLTDGPTVVMEATASGQALDSAQSAIAESPLADNETTSGADVLVADNSASDEIAAQDPAVEADVLEDLVHEVAAGENLWDIAKATTGDANNWHLLADINDLGQNATVFPGQQLIIPADMLKQNYDAPIAPELAAANDTDLIDLGQGTGIFAVDPVTGDPVSGTTDLQLTAVSEAAMPFDIDNGETLWDFAKRTTGDATNWQAIASHNLFTEKQAVTVRPGQTIYVPQTLVKNELGADIPTKVSANANPLDVPAISNENAVDLTNNAIAAQGALPTVAQTALPADVESTSPAAVEAASSDVTAALPLPADTGKSLAIVEKTGNLVDETLTQNENQTMKIVEATYRTDDSLDPVKAEELAVQTIQNPDTPAQIKVSGTYYPKAIYNNADFSASLLMRVSPGTTLQVSKAMGTWFEVKTEKGVGYMHQRDIQ